MHLYDFDLSPFAARCRFAVYKKELPVAFVPPPEGGPRSDEYRALNPLGKVPALVLDDGAVIPESEVILEYLEDRFPTPALRPDLPEARARMRLLARIGDLYLLPAMGKLFGQMRAEHRDQAVIDPAMVDLAMALDGIEHFIAPTGWAAAEGCTLADCALVPQLFVLANLLPAFGRTDPLATHPKTAAYWQRVQPDPVVTRVVGEMQAGLARMLGKG